MGVVEESGGVHSECGAERGDGSAGGEHILSAGMDGARHDVEDGVGVHDAGERGVSDNVAGGVVGAGEERDTERAGGGSVSCGVVLCGEDGAGHTDMLHIAGDIQQLAVLDGGAASRGRVLLWVCGSGGAELSGGRVAVHGAGGGVAGRGGGEHIVVHRDGDLYAVHRVSGD